MASNRAGMALDLNSLPYSEVVALVRQGAAYIKVNQSALSFELHRIPPSPMRKAAGWIWIPAAVGFAVLFGRHSYVWAIACVVVAGYSMLAARKSDARRAAYAVLEDETLYQDLLRAKAIRVLPR